MRDEIKKILLECIYTPDAKPRFIGGDLDKKLAYIDATVDKLLALQVEAVTNQNAYHYLCNDDVSIEEQVKSIEAQAEINSMVMIDDVEGVTVWEKIENSFSCDEFLDLIS